MLAALITGIALVAPPQFDFYAEKPYDAAIPKPDDTLGYSIGSRHTNFRDQERALMAIANGAGKRVKVVEFGKSWEGRPLRIFIVSSPENMARLAHIQKNNQARANGQAAPANDPALVWVNECIHGDETASFESGMALLYNLSASRSPRIKGMLDKAVVFINPSYNPDGHERYVVYYNSIATGSSEPGSFESSAPNALYGRSNHYRFDMNRDRIAMSQAETRQEVAEYLKWFPQVYIDQHGQVETYFFPPNAMSQNVNTDRDRVNKWTEVFGRATGKAFDRQGWTYFIKDTFDLYYPGYLDSYTTLSGSIGMTHETDGGRYLVRKRSDDTTLTLRDGMMKHFTSALAVVEASATHSSELVTSFASYKRKAVTGEFAGKFKRVVIQGEPRALGRLADQLSRSGIRYSFAKDSWNQKDAHDYWSNTVGEKTFAAGSLVIDMAQSQAQLAKALLEPDSDFEPEFAKAQLEKKKTAPEGETYPGPEGAEFYDTTAWALPYAHNLRAWWCESAPPVAANEFGIRTGGGPEGGTDSQAGFALVYKDDSDALAVFDALGAGIKAMVTTRPMSLGTRHFPRGTFMFLRARNEGDYDAKLRNTVNRRGADLVPISTSYPEAGRQGPGSETVIALRKPNIGVVFGNTGSLAQAGTMWYLMEQEFKLPFTSLSTAALNGDLSKYTCIVVPSGTGASATQKLRDWVSAGGCLVVLGGLNWATGGGGFAELQATESDDDLPGAIFKAELDPRSFLGYGYQMPESGPIPIAVPVDGGNFFKARKEGGSVVKFNSDEKTKKALSGWVWPEKTEKALAGTTWLQDAPVGRGHAVLFTFDPTARAMWPGLYKLLLNAMLIGPSA